jgi:hypothetical protein
MILAIIDFDPNRFHENYHIFYKFFTNYHIFHKYFTNAEYSAMPSKIDTKRVWVNRLILYGVW